MTQLEIKHIIPLNSNINLPMKGAFTILEANGTRVKGRFSRIAHNKWHSHVGVLPYFFIFHIQFTTMC
jgi:hypothetical protein